MPPDENQDLREYLDDRFGLVERRLNGLDERITVNARERLQGFKAIHDRLDRLNGTLNGGTREKAKTGGLSALVAAFIVAFYEAVRRLAL